MLAPGEGAAETGGSGGYPGSGGSGSDDSGPHPSARMTNQPPPIVSPHRCGAAGRWNSDSTRLSWAQAQSTHHPNAKTNLPSAPVRAAATGSGTATLLAQ